MLDHEQLVGEWTTDAKFDTTRLMEEMYRQPLLHAKYVKFLTNYKVAVRKHHLKYDSLKSLKIRYYNGEMNQQELEENGWTQYKFNKPLKSQMDSLLDADPDLQKIVERVEYIKILIDTTESILREIHSRGYLLKTILENRKFEAGV